MVETQREREDKYDVPADYNVPDLAGIGAGVVERATVRLHTTYYDTVDHTLLTYRVTLRRREGDVDVGWQLKVPGKQVRTEIRLPLGDSAQVPDQLADLVAGLVDGAALQPIAELRTERRLHRLQIDGRTAVEVADDRVHATAAGSVLRTSEWREVEAELAGGTERHLARVGKRLRSAGATPATSSSKLARTIGTAEPASSAVRLVRDYLLEQLVALGSGDIALRRGLDPIHKTRVAARRLRSIVRVFGPAFADDTTALDAELSWYQDLLGEVRDPQVQRARFAAALAQLPPELVLGPVAADVEQTLLAEQLIAFERLVAELDGRRYRDLMKQVSSWARHPLLRNGITDKDLQRLAGKARRRSRRRLAAALATRDADDLHRARKALKRSRYAVELVAPLQPTQAKKILRRHKQVQDVLGEHQDSVVAAELLQRLGIVHGVAADRNGFTYGVLWQREIERGERARQAVADLA